MKKWILSAVVLLFTATAISQTNVSIGSGLLEQSNSVGIGVPISVGVHRDIVENTGVSVVYTYGFLKHSNNLQQLQLNAYQRIIVDYSLSLKLNAGAARQVSGNLYPSFGVDIIAKSSNRTGVFLAWSPVIRGEFRDPCTGWSHTVMIGTLIRL